MERRTETIYLVMFGVLVENRLVNFPNTIQNHRRPSRFGQLISYDYLRSLLVFVPYTDINQINLKPCSWTVLKRRA